MTCSGAFIFASLCMSSSLLFALVWGLRLLWRRLRGRAGLPGGPRGDLSVRAMPLLAVVTFAAAQIGLAVTPLWQWGAPRPGTILFFVATLAFALVSPAALFVAARSFRLPDARRPGRAVRVHSLLVALSSTGMALYLGANHLIGLRIWAW